MAGQTLGPLPKYWTIGKAEKNNLDKAIKRPLSGYIGGYPSTGYWVNELSDSFRNEFGVGFAVPCNSATSGLMAACMAAGIGPGDEVWVSAYTMSATATAAMILGATIKFVDIEDKFFTIDCMHIHTYHPKAIIVTNLFGSGACLPWLRGYCDAHHIILIEDNAQAPYATVGGKLTGTFGHMGVFSFNVHKHIQCGEGGVVVTDSGHYADWIERAINHGELHVNFDEERMPLGGNFRMTEPIAAIACAQLKKGMANVMSRIALAENITEMFRDIPFVEPPQKRFGEVHSYYMWAGKIKGNDAATHRRNFIARLQARGVPFKVGYITPLHRLFEDNVHLPVVEEIEDERLFTFEICAYDLKVHHLKRMKAIILEEAEQIEKERVHGTQEISGERSDRSSGELSGSY